MADGLDVTTEDDERKHMLFSSTMSLSGSKQQPEQVGQKVDYDTDSHHTDYIPASVRLPTANKVKMVHKRTVSEICRDIKKEWWICSICLELMYRPHKVIPCQHVFCQGCLQTLAIRNPSRTDCPLCRTLIVDCLLQESDDRQIAEMFPIEHGKMSEADDRNKPLPGRSARRNLSIGQWLRHTLGNRERRHMEGTDRSIWHFCSFLIMITVVICTLYLGHGIILVSRYMSDYIPEVPVPNEIKLANVPLIVIGFISTLVLLCR